MQTTKLYWISDRGNNVTTGIAQGEQNAAVRTEDGTAPNTTRCLRISMCAEPVDGLNADGSTGILKSDEFLYTMRNVTMPKTYSEALLLDPQNAAIWPGALLDGDKWARGVYSPLAGARTPLSISLSLPGAPAPVSVETPTLPTVRAAIDKLRADLPATPPPAWAQDGIVDVHSPEHLRAVLNGSFDAGVARLESMFDFSNPSYSHVLVKYIQRLYTVEVALPTGGAELFVSGREPLPDDLIVSSVTYGRMLLFAFESTESIESLKAAVNFAFRLSSANATNEARYTWILASAQVHLLMIGDQPGIEERAVSGGINAIRQAFAAATTSGASAAARPIAYRMRFLQGYADATICLTASYTERTRNRMIGKIRVKNVRLYCVSEDDWGSEMEIFGKVWVRGKMKDSLPGIGGVTSTGGDLVWNVAEDDCMNLAPGGTINICSELVFTFKDIHLPQVWDKALIEVSAQLYEEDNGADPPFNGGPGEVFMSNLVPNQLSHYEVVFRGEGEVKILFDVELL
ncbi:MAG: hypothetical protein HGA45_01350 [Chloroflexales bacterium]|nr:hypothetical protein [Chloroflexales bacterium]